MKEKGLDPWLDVKKLLPGQKSRTPITEAIRDSKYFLALLSSHSVSKQGFFQKELKNGLDIVDECPEHDIYFIPVRLDDCRLTGEKLQELHWADLFPSYESGLQLILKVLAPTAASVPALESRKSEKVRKGGKAVEVLEKPVKTVLRSEPTDVSLSNWKAFFQLNDNFNPLSYTKND